MRRVVSAERHACVTLSSQSRWCDPLRDTVIPSGARDLGRWRWTLVFAQ